MVRAGPRKAREAPRASEATPDTVHESSDAQDEVVNMELLGLVLAREACGMRLAQLVYAARAYRDWWNAYDGVENHLALGHELLGRIRQSVDALDAVDAVARPQDTQGRAAGER